MRSSKDRSIRRPALLSRASALMLIASGCGEPVPEEASALDARAPVAVSAAALDVTTTLTPVADAEVWLYAPNSNYGAVPTMRVNSDQSESYLRFDLSGLPSNARVKHVSLSTTAFDGYAFGGDGNVYTTFVADDTWAETGITWNNKPPVSEWLGSWFLWYGSTQEDRVGINADPALVPVVQRELNGDKLLSFRLHSPGYYTHYYSREHVNDAQRPRLTITYDIVGDVVTTLEPEADTYATWSSGTSGSNYGGDTEMKVLRFDAGTPFLRFNLSSIPAGAVIKSVKLSATSFTGYAYGGDGAVYTFLVPDNSWGEHTLTWNNKPATAPGHLGWWFIWYAWNDFRDERVINDSPALVAPVQAASNAVDRRVSFMLQSTGYDTRYYTRELVDTSKRPTLEVTYTP